MAAQRLRGRWMHYTRCICVPKLPVTDLGYRGFITTVPPGCRNHPVDATQQKLQQHSLSYDK